ncbi:hypothetical protein [Xenorhabdus bovienii]|uniref:hypothetical protein n=1 Tax=Xenorhabdus bovienii TaxID=40576 RepID=UPI0023B3572F|nr:hypothetical protein [Xenorhabdus bovienii]MDE9483070.1 hypothetical protein [Xenorhabdus bovienii]
MAKKQEIATDGLGGLPPELQVNATESIPEPPPEPAMTTFSDESPSDEDDSISDEQSPEWVVMKGNTVQHDGVVYPENSVIYLSGEDAERLIQLGVVMRLDALKSQLLSGNSVTVQDGVKIQQEA